MTDRDEEYDTVDEMPEDVRPIAELLSTLQKQHGADNAKLINTDEGFDIVLSFTEDDDGDNGTGDR